jgi:hypothetical protein
MMSECFNFGMRICELFFNARVEFCEYFSYVEFELVAAALLISQLELMSISCRITNRECSNFRVEFVSVSDAGYILCVDIKARIARFALVYFQRKVKN